jgi:hypothetical protein
MCYVFLRIERAKELYDNRRIKRENKGQYFNGRRKKTKIKRVQRIDTKAPRDTLKLLLRA